MTILFPYMARWNSANMSRYYHLFNKVADLGHNVIVVQPPPRSSEETNYIDLPLQSHPNITLFTVRMPAWLWNLKFPVDKFIKKALYTVGSFFLIRRLKKEHTPDALVLYNIPQYIYTWWNDAPVVFDYADDYTAMLQHELGISPSNPAAKFTSYILNRLTQKATLVTSVSQVLNDRVQHPNKRLLPNGADVTIPRGERTILHIDKNKPVIGYVGAFEYFIDLDLMLSAAENLASCTFLFVGAGRKFAWFKEEVITRKLTNVILTGAVPHHQAMQFISEMDICLNLFVPGPVADAASPIKLFEYLASGKPVITTCLKETQRIDREMHSLFYAGNLPELIDRVKYILTNESVVAQNVARARDLVTSSYSWTSIARDFVDGLEKTLEARHSTAA